MREEDITEVSKQRIRRIDVRRGKRQETTNHAGRTV